MITGTHAIIYATDAEAARAFFRDILGFPSVDAHDGWLIFQLPPAELGIHPSPPGDPAAAASAERQELYLMCDDIRATVAELTATGVEFTSDVQNQGWGLLVRLKVPGAGEIGLYEPRHATAHTLDG